MPLKYEKKKKYFAIGRMLKFKCFFVCLFVHKQKLYVHNKNKSKLFHMNRPQISPIIIKMILILVSLFIPRAIVKYVI